MSRHPPSLARGLVSILVPPGPARDGLLGDMHEMYVERYESKGWLISSAWYWWSAMHAAAGYSFERYVNRRRPSQRTQVAQSGYSAAIIDTILQDVRYSTRLFKRSPGFTAVAALTIALGIGATSTVFSVVDSLLLRTPPGVRDPEGLVSIAAVKEGRSFLSTISYPTFEDYRDAENGLGEMAAVASFPASLSTGGAAEPENVAGLMVSANYFSLLGTRPALGRFFLPEEDVVGDPRPVVVLSHEIWARRFGADSAIVGQTISVNRTRFTVIGVAEEGFQGHYWVYDFGLWVPVAMAAAVSEWDTSQRGNTNLVLVGRLAPGSSIAHVSQSLAATADRLRHEYPEYYDDTEHMAVHRYSGMQEEARVPVSVFMALMFIVAGIVLLIASANVAGMLLSRTASRAREMAVRLSVGAGKARLVRMLVTESVMLFLMGGTIGVFFTLWSTEALESFRPPIPIPMAFDLTLDLRVLGFTLALALITGTLFGLAPALQATRADLASSLKDERAGAGVARRSLGNAFVVAQVAGSVVLLIGAGLFTHALARADSVDLGFDPNNVHALTVDLSIHQYSDDEVQVLLTELQQRAASLPGVESAALSSMPPLGFTSARAQFRVPGRESDPDGGYHVAAINAVSSDYFDTMQIPITAGRSFADSDNEVATRVVVINQTAADQLWPGESALGKHITYGDAQYRIVGVAGDGKYASLTEHSVMAVYRAFPQRVYSTNTLLVRTVPGREAIGKDIRDIARLMDPDLPIQGNAPYTQIIGISLLPNRVAASVAAAFGAAGVLLAAVGLFGVLSSAVSQRKREIGIRMALGADLSSVRKMVIGGGLKLTALGLVIGFPIAFAAVLLIRSMLFGVSPVDPITFGGIAGLLLLVSLLASYVPVRRATRTDPAEALRAE
jgi:predicted permease